MFVMYVIESYILCYYVIESYILDITKGTFDNSPSGTSNYRLGGLVKYEGKDSLGECDGIMTSEVNSVMVKNKGSDDWSGDYIKIFLRGPKYLMCFKNDNQEENRFIKNGENVKLPCFVHERFESGGTTKSVDIKLNSF